ncbi:unnamed protein product [Caenorhabditis auriculariae]|uniref:4-hydroxy-3-methoxy-5-polyprenylbenzoate decarboxylase n=1 Tax=Caenorhabditis auriculariae TaxID=2777116 RepID=A0A8S1GY21_9PELO|nr:unnamed protein product [Caenorhabditis auriculariae]
MQNVMEVWGIEPQPSPMLRERSTTELYPQLSVVARKMAAASLYASHVPLSSVSRLFLALGSAATAILDPRRGDMVAAMGETTAVGSVLENIRMESDRVGRRLLREKPRVCEATIDRRLLERLPDGTFGKEYSKFLDALKTSPDARPPVRYINQPEHLYVMQRYRETHDFTHVALQMNTNMLGEVTVKYFEAIQLGLPMCVTGAVFGSARLQTKNRRELLNRYLPWVTEQAQNSRLFLAFDWENHFAESLRDVQRELNIKYDVPVVSSINRAAVRASSQKSDSHEMRLVFLLLVVCSVVPLLALRGALFRPGRSVPMNDFLRFGRSGSGSGTSSASMEVLPMMPIRWDRPLDADYVSR